MKLKHLILSLAAVGCAPTFAASTLNLGGYSVSGTYALDLVAGTNGSVSGLEASAVTYARDRGTLFYVGDEGTGVVEVSRTGQTLGAMSFNWAGTGSTKNDSEGLTYLGGGVLALAEERLQDVYRFSYTPGGVANLANSFVSISNANVGNSGIEGISFDARNGGSFVTVKQENPQNILAGSLTFATSTGGLPAKLPSNGASPTGGGTSTMSVLFGPASLGVTTLSDVQTLSSVDRLVGTTAADNLLVLSLGSRRLVEVDRQGNVLSFFDLANVLPHNGIEGVTVDENGVIYLVAEQVQDGSNLPFDLNPKSQLIVLTPVPEPETFAMLLAGLGLLGVVTRRKKLRAEVVAR